MALRQASCSSLSGRDVPNFRNFFHGFAMELRQTTMGIYDQYGSGATAACHFLLNSLQQLGGRILHSFGQTRDTAIVCPPGSQGRQTGGTCVVGILVTCDFDATLTCLLQHGEKLVSFAPLRFAHQLQMRDFQMDARTLGNVQHFFHGLEDTVTFTAHVDCKNAIVSGQYLGKSDQFV